MEDRAVPPTDVTPKGAGRVANLVADDRLRSAGDQTSSALTLRTCLGERRHKGAQIFEPSSEPSERLNRCVQAIYGGLEEW
jgi:hypothetical protein